MNGWIILDKPVGISSAMAVAKVKSLLTSSYKEKAKKEKIKIGHAGTLDPLASGILPLAVGDATKTVAYIMNATKSYNFTVTWGQERATDDSEGAVLFESDKRPTLADITTILPQFIGNITQIPPNYSAIKLAGERAYNLSRNGQKVTIAARNVTVNSLELTCHPALVAGSGITNSDVVVEQDPNSKAGSSSFLCHCGKGTYIRSLARDMGRILGCYGYISNLRRLSVGKFNENCSILLENLPDIVHKDEGDFLQPVESALDDILAWDIDSVQALHLRHGQTINIPYINSGNGESVSVLARNNGKAVAICKCQAGVMKPVRVFNK